MEEEEKEIKRAARKAEEKELIYQVLSPVPFTFLESHSCLAFPQKYLQIKREFHRLKHHLNARIISF